MCCRENPVRPCCRNSVEPRCLTLKDVVQGAQLYNQSTFLSLGNYPELSPNYGRVKDSTRVLCGHLHPFERPRDAPNVEKN